MRYVLPIEGMMDIGARDPLATRRCHLEGGILSCSQYPVSVATFWGLCGFGQRKPAVVGLAWWIYWMVRYQSPWSFRDNGPGSWHRTLLGRMEGWRRVTTRPRTSYHLSRLAEAPVAQINMLFDAVVMHAWLGSSAPRRCRGASYPSFPTITQPIFTRHGLFASRRCRYALLASSAAWITSISVEIGRFICTATASRCIAPITPFLGSGLGFPLSQDRSTNRLKQMYH